MVPGLGSAQAYRIDAVYDPLSRTIDGTVSLQGNSSCEDTDKSLWKLPANRFNEDFDVGGELLHRRVFPWGFSPGYSLVGGRGRGEPFVESQGPTQSFLTKIPHRTGVFGQFDGTLTLQGGWFPTLVTCGATVLAGELGEGELKNNPPLSTMDVELHLTLPTPWSALINGELHSGPHIVTHLRNVVMVSLFAQGNLRGRALGTTQLFGSSPSRLQLRNLERAHGEFEAFWADLGLPLAHKPLPIALVANRRYLAELAQGQVFLSQGALAVAVRSAHQPAVIQALCAARFFRWLGDFESLEPEQRWWLSDALAWHLMESYRSWRTRGFDVEAAIQPLSVLPGFDQLLYAPRFAFAQEVYGDPFLIDPLEESLIFSYKSGPPGRVIALKLEDHFALSMMAEVLEALKRGDDPWAALLSSGGPGTAEDVQAYLQAWSRPYPLENLILKRGPELDGLTAISVERTSQDVLPPETLSVAVSLKGQGTQTYIWRAPGGASSSSPLWQVPEKATVEVDAKRHVLEADSRGLVLRGDNRSPRDWKFIVGGMLSALDVGQLYLDGYFGLSFMPRYDRKHLINVSAFADDVAVAGLSSSYFRYFGAARDAVWRQQRLGLEVSSSLRRSGDIGAYYPGVSGKVAYRYETRQDFFQPSSGTRLTASLKVETLFEEQSFDLAINTDLPGGCANQKQALNPGSYGAVSLSAVKLFSLAPSAVLGVRGLLDWAPGQGEQGLYSLGGSSALRGLATCDIQGSGRGFVGLEYRQRLVEDLDISLYFVHLRTVQAVFFLEAGGAWYPEVLAASGGAGLRVHVQSLGIQPAMIGFDVAWPVAESVAMEPRYLLRFTQSF